MGGESSSREGRVEELAEVVKAAQAGDPEAFSELVARFQDKAYAAAGAHLHDHHLAQDAAQEAFVEAYVSLPNLKEPAAFPGWFRQILFRRCLRCTREHGFAVLPLEAALEVASKEPGPDQAAEEGEMKAQVLTALRSLPDHERMFLQLFYISGCSYRHIAEFLGVPLTTVKKRLYSARHRLKAKMITLDEEELHLQRPSRDGRFAHEVEARSTARRGRSS